RMKEYSDAMEYEKAAQLRDKIAAVNRIWQRQGVVSDDCREHDVFALTSDGLTQCVCVLNIRDGRVKLKESSFFDCDETESGPELLTSFVCEYYGEHEILPVVVLATEPEDFALLRDWLSAERGKRVSLRCKGRGELPKTARICLDNAEEALVQYSVRRGGRKKTKAAEELKGYLGISGELTRIEAFDISHTGGKTTVGAMVVFENGAPKKSDYRRFRVSVSGGDDYAATAEVISRRLAHLGEKGFERPDVILLDGGSQHVAAISALFAEKGVDIPLFGMVKDNKHSLRGLVAPEGEIDIGKTTRAFRLVYAVSEEVHRFAISYHHAARSAELKTSQLTVIDGVGEARAKALLKAFGSIDGVRSASVEELAAVKGMSRPAAENVKKFFAAIPAEE
ncbi:MAG: UvrB/UvrC motif-containing protein, partial [Clostridia bacterium]|nr:UvrB/UvrC motif-containing protein [Clostridia bacterium]